MTNRPLKVGEIIKKALNTLIKEEIAEPLLETTSIIISEVKVTPNLQLATIYMLPMTGSTINNEQCLTIFNSNIKKIRKLLCKKIYMRNIPELIFKIDTSFEYATKINTLIRN